MTPIMFVILTWNSEKYIDRCLKSIAALHGYDRTIYLVDNGSTDQTLEIIEQWKQQVDANAKIVLIENQTNWGTTRSRNAALMQMDATVDWICILDSDTEINQSAIDVLVHELSNHIDYGIVGPKLRSEDGSVQDSGRNIPNLPIKLLKAIPFKAIQRIGEWMELPPNRSETSPYEVGYLMSACWLMRREVIEHIGLLDEKIFYAPEDVEYCIRVWKSGYKVMYCPQAEIFHAWQRISRKKLVSKVNWEHMKGLAYMFSKYHCWFCTKNIMKGQEESSSE